MPLATAARRICPIFFDVDRLLDAPITVISCETICSLAAADASVTADFAVCRRFVFGLWAVGCRKQADFDESARVDQIIDAFTCVESAGGRLFSKLFGTTHTLRFGLPTREFSYLVVKGHRSSFQYNLFGMSFRMKEDHPASCKNVNNLRWLGRPQNRAIGGSMSVVRSLVSSFLAAAGNIEDGTGDIRGRIGCEPEGGFRDLACLAGAPHWHKFSGPVALSGRPERA